MVLHGAREVVRQDADPTLGQAVTGRPQPRDDGHVADLSIRRHDSRPNVIAVIGQWDQRPRLKLDRKLWPKRHMCVEMMFGPKGNP